MAAATQGYMHTSTLTSSDLDCTCEDLDFIPVLAANNAPVVGHWPLLELVQHRPKLLPLLPPKMWAMWYLSLNNLQDNHHKIFSQEHPVSIQMAHSSRIRIFSWSRSRAILWWRLSTSIERWFVYSPIGEMMNFWSPPQRMTLKLSKYTGLGGPIPRDTATQRTIMWRMSCLWTDSQRTFVFTADPGVLSLTCLQSFMW